MRAGVLGVELPPPLYCSLHADRRPSGTGSRGGLGAVQREAWKCLAINAFTSKRKRSSMVVQAPDGQHWLLAKGADNVMLDRAEHGPCGGPVWFRCRSLRRGAPGVADNGVVRH